MNFDVKSYARIYPNWVSEEMCKSILTDLNNTNWQKHCYWDGIGRQFETHDNDLSITVNLPQWTERINERIWKCLEQYIVKDLDLSWYNNWRGFTNVRYNKYEVGTEMRLHCDHIHSMFDGERKGIPTLSVLGCLNNDYEGGELVMWENEIINLKAGDIMIFPSNFLYPHKVMPVTKGTRYSYVSWVW